MVINLIDVPRQFLFDLRCLLFFLAVAGAVFILNRDHSTAVVLPSKPAKAKPRRGKPSK